MIFKEIAISNPIRQIFNKIIFNLEDDGVDGYKWHKVKNGDSLIIVNLNRVNYIKYGRNKLSFHFGNNHKISLSDEVELKDEIS